jgi:hypothetical protein
MQYLVMQKFFALRISQRGTERLRCLLQDMNAAEGRGEVTVTSVLDSSEVADVVGSEDPPLTVDLPDLPPVCSGHALLTLREVTYYAFDSSLDHPTRAVVPVKVHTPLKPYLLVSLGVLLAEGFSQQEFQTAPRGGTGASPRGA